MRLREREREETRRETKWGNIKSDPSRRECRVWTIFFSNCQSDSPSLFVLSRLNPMPRFTAFFSFYRVDNYGAFIGLRHLVISFRMCDYYFYLFKLQTHFDYRLLISSFSAKVHFILYWNRSNFWILATLPDS